MSEGAFEARVSHWRTLLLALLGAGFVVIGVFFVLHAEDVAGGSRRLGNPTLVQMFGWIAILFFGGCTLAGLRQLMRTGPVVRIDAEGVWWQRWSDAIVPWDAIYRAAITSVANQRFLSLWLHEPDRHRSTHMLGSLARANRGMGQGDIAIPSTGLDRSLADMVGAVERFAPPGMLRR